MQKSISLSIVLMLVLCGSNAARAEFMDWSYHWSISPAPVMASGTGTVSVALGWAGTGSTNLLAAALTTSSVASASQPDVYHDKVNMTLHITDQATHQSGNLTFTGSLNGWVTGNNAQLRLNISTPTEHIDIGGHEYWVRLPEVTQLLHPGSSTVPTLYAQVQVWNVAPPHLTNPGVTPASTFHPASAPTGPSTASTPEPPSLLLAGLSISLLGFRGTWRLRRKVSRAA
jgi:hypothetical protein